MVEQARALLQTGHQEVRTDQRVTTGRGGPVGKFFFSPVVHLNAGYRTSAVCITVSCLALFSLYLFLCAVDSLHFLIILPMAGRQLPSTRDQEVKVLRDFYLKVPRRLSVTTCSILDRTLRQRIKVV